MVERLRHRRPFRALSAVLVVGICLASCGGDGSPRRDRATPAATTPSAPADDCPVFGQPRRAGAVSGLGLEEISGVVASERHDVLWVHEDSGADPVVYAITPDGEPVATVDVTNADHIDWEDIALGAGKLWIGDIGDNASIRVSGIQVYWFPEPDPVSRSVEANVLSLTYEDGPHDAEALIVDARNDALYVITKELSLTEGSVYRVPIDGLRDGDLRELTRVGTVPLGIVTAADLSSEGVIVKSYGKALLFPWTDDRRIESAIEEEGCHIPLGGGESVAYREADDIFYAIPEGANPPIWTTSRT
jgi:hypothetical protein